MLFKRGLGITLDESLNAAEYLASEGNRKIVFGLRGMKTNLGDPHRNFVDFAHVPVVKRLTRMPVCIDPSHSVGTRAGGARRPARHLPRRRAGRRSPAPTWCWSTSIRTPRRRWSTGRRRCCCPSCRISSTTSRWRAKRTCKRVDAAPRGIARALVAPPTGTAAATARRDRIKLRVRAGGTAAGARASGARAAERDGARPHVAMLRQPYYDTPALALPTPAWRCACAASRRAAGCRRSRAPATPRGGVHRRAEYEWPLPRARACDRRAAGRRPRGQKLLAKRRPRRLAAGVRRPKSRAPTLPLAFADGTAPCCASTSATSARRPQAQRRCAKSRSS